MHARPDRPCPSKGFVLFLGLMAGLMAVLLYWANRSPNPPAPQTEAATAPEQIDRTPAQEEETLPNVSTQSQPSAQARGQVDADSRPAQPPETRVVIHTARDFTNGQRQDLDPADGLRLAADATPGTNTDQIVGSYTSPERTPPTPEDQMREAFDIITLNCDAVAPPGSGLRLEFRTKSVAEGTWSPWKEAGPGDWNVPLQLASVEESWQYRLTLSAPDALHSPQVRSISVATQKSPAVTPAMFGSNEGGAEQPH